VAIGAAYQAAALSGELSSLRLLDITPLSLGIEVYGGMTKTVIQRNTKIPTKVQDHFTTAQDNQPVVDLHVVQGERPMACDNKSLGLFRIAIPAGPRGTIQVETTFSIDANGILLINAREGRQAKGQDLVISDTHALSDNEINRFQEEAKQFLEEDKNKSQTAHHRCIMVDIAYECKRILQQYPTELTSEEHQQLELVIGLAEKEQSNNTPSTFKERFQSISKQLTPLRTRIQHLRKKGAPKGEKTT
jgi:molecular chaperone DnaK